jgi:hypothetical protein
MLPRKWEVNHRNMKRKAAEVYPFLEAYIVNKEQQISEIEQVVVRYERKRLMEERAYQSMSSFRRMFSGKRPDHHLAVEYIHFVKKPMEQARKLRNDIDRARLLLNESKASDEITLPSDMEQDFFKL